jgi:hypothetical protein
MFPIGAYQNGVQYPDGVYGGLTVTATAGLGSAGLNVRVGAGLGKVGNVVIEQGPAGAATNILCPDAAVSYVYLNHPDALDAAGGATATFDIKKEGDHTHTPINGSTTSTQLKGRSILLAKVTTAGGAVTAIDNAIRMAPASIPNSMLSEQIGR